jgi:hypothetical protein
LPLSHDSHAGGLEPGQGGGKLGCPKSQMVKPFPALVDKLLYEGILADRLDQLDNRVTKLEIDHPKALFRTPALEQKAGAQSMLEEVARLLDAAYRDRNMVEINQRRGTPPRPLLRFAGGLVSAGRAASLGRSRYQRTLS